MKCILFEKSSVWRSNLILIRLLYHTKNSQTSFDRGLEKCLTIPYYETTLFIALCEHLMLLIAAQISHNSAPYLLAYGEVTLLIESVWTRTILGFGKLRIWSSLELSSFLKDNWHLDVHYFNTSDLTSYCMASSFLNFRIHLILLSSFHNFYMSLNWIINVFFVNLKEHSN